MREGGEDLLAVDDPLVAVTLGARRAGEDILSARGFGVAQADENLAGRNAGQNPGLQLS